MESRTIQLEARVCRLERHNWWLTIALVVLCSAVLVGYAMPKQDEISAERFVLVDGDGQERAKWLVNDQNVAALELGDAIEDSTWTILTSAGLALYDERPKRRHAAIYHATGFSIEAAGGGRVWLTTQELDPILESIGPALSLTYNGRELTIGRAGLIDKSTGSLVTRPVSSIVMFDDSSNVVWKAP